MGACFWYICSLITAPLSYLHLMHHKDEEEKRSIVESGPWMCKDCTETVVLFTLYSSTLTHAGLEILQQIRNVECLRQNRLCSWLRLIITILTVCDFCFTSALLGNSRDNSAAYIHNVETITLTSLLPCCFKVQDKLNTPFPLSLKLFKTRRQRPGLLSLR